MAEERDEDKRPLWVLSVDEQRLLLITFVGGLASIVVGGAMIGFAIAYAKWQAAKQPPVPVGHTLVGVAGMLIAIGAVLWKSRGLPRWLRWGLAIVEAVLSGTALLWIVGVAAGIH